ncbi:MAG: hypothetical protein V2I45_09580 [Halieaceae bacterium]|nr:hypothetical protein [Halieaceae bacterium]
MKAAGKDIRFGGVIRASLAAQCLLGVCLLGASQVMAGSVPVGIKPDAAMLGPVAQQLAQSEKPSVERYAPHLVAEEAEHVDLAGPIDSEAAYAALPQAKRAEVPLPGAIWLFGSALFGFVFLSNRNRV